MTTGTGWAMVSAASVSASSDSAATASNVGVNCADDASEDDPNPEDGSVGEDTEAGISYKLGYND